MHWKSTLTLTELKKVPRVGTLQWMFLLLATSILIIIPFVLAYVTSFYTLTIGLSCRTLTFVLYFVFQFLLTILWLYDFEYHKQHEFHCVIGSFGLILLFFFGSSITAIIGTFMQILGVYRNYLCNFPMVTVTYDGDGYGMKP